MIWDNPYDAPWLQRVKNWALYLLPLTNRERDKAKPWIGAAVLLYLAWRAWRWWAGA